jgi:hypothetical protein
MIHKRGKDKRHNYEIISVTYSKLFYYYYLLTERTIHTEKMVSFLITEICLLSFLFDIVRI